ncbi:MAG: NADP-dependent phosphogluconate dehydrogenase [Elusimicrobiales bacterium]|jgi:6-phosphogluconate dehydrogenase|nr:NADP-dependent phosphogluconate dehydrogenase [Elusimicrobiales bacterium]NLH39371.1 NADP-dependent phosphogluconate dehydrogenase [Elusimicrobiota bacterium]
MVENILVVGAGRMGGGISRRLMKAGFRPYIFDIDYSKAKEVAGKKGRALKNFSDFKTEGRRVVWLMLPSGKVTEDYVNKSIEILSKGDVLIDGGNSKWSDSIKRADMVSKKGIYFVDAGVSGGLYGERDGYCVMVGGDKKGFSLIEKYLKAIAQKDAYLYCGDSGSGHFVKMIHNGIEYAIMQAYAEGFELIKSFDGLKTPTYKIAGLFNRGSIIRSWLLELVYDILKEDDNLNNIKAYIDDSGEGRWSIEYALLKAIPAETITDAAFRRFRSRMSEPFSEKLIAALRNKFGGHKVVKK